MTTVISEIAFEEAFENDVSMNFTVFFLRVYVSHKKPKIHAWRWPAKLKCNLWTQTYIQQNEINRDEYRSEVIRVLLDGWLEFHEPLNLTDNQNSALHLIKCNNSTI